MIWRSGYVGLAAAFLAVAGCDGRGGVERAAPGPAPAAAVAAPEVRPYAGRTFTVFTAEVGARYTPDELGLAANDRARLWRGMAAGGEGALMEGGGAEALVFRGCAETGCAEGVSVVAVDTASGAVFAAVRDGGGADVLAPNDRLEALLRLNSPTRDWADASAQAAPAQH